MIKRMSWFACVVRVITTMGLLASPYVFAGTLMSSLKSSQLSAVHTVLRCDGAEPTSGPPDQRTVLPGTNVPAAGVAARPARGATSIVAEPAAVAIRRLRSIVRSPRRSFSKIRDLSPFLLPGGHHTVEEPRSAGGCWRAGGRSTVAGAARRIR